MAQETPRQRILVADDTDFFRTMLTHVLSDEGYEVETTSDGSSALELLEQQPQQYRLLGLPFCTPLQSCGQFTQLSPAPVSQGHSDWRFPTILEHLEHSPGRKNLRRPS